MNQLRTIIAQYEQDSILKMGFRMYKKYISIIIPNCSNGHV